MRLNLPAKVKNRLPSQTEGLSVPFPYLRLIEDVKRTTEDETIRVVHRVGNTRMGDMSPNEFFNKMASFNATTDMNLLRNLWFGRLPEQLKIKLADQRHQPVKAQLEMADAVYSMALKHTSHKRGGRAQFLPSGNNLQ